MNKIVNVVLSGGSGTRFWPLSRKSKPKQFLKIFTKKSLFQHTIIRNKLLVDDFMLLTNIDQENQGVSQIDELNIPFKHKIIEPIGRNTAPAIALAAMSVNRDDILFVTPSDHMVSDVEEYEKSIKEGITLANKGFLVTFGITPEYPETGYGYIESRGEDIVSFREKPDYKTAISFIEKENFYWNSGMFCFKAGVFLTELQKYRMDIFEASKKALDSNNKGYIEYEDMINIPNESIDYAVFEKSDLIKTVKSEFQWTDLGSFDSLISYFNKNNIVEGISWIKGVDNLNSYSIGKKEVCGIGVSDLTVVDTEDCILVLPNQSVSRIKELHSNIKESLL